MTEQRRNLTVGLFALVGLGILAGLIMAFGDVLTFVTARAYNINVHFPQGATTQVREGIAVTLKGKRVGHTKFVDFRNPSRPAEGIKVVIAVEGRYDLPQGTRAEVQTSIMGFGRPALLLVVDDVAPATEHFLPRDGTGEIIGRVVPPLDQLVRPDIQTTLETSARQIGDLAGSLVPVAQDLHRLFEVRTLEQVDGDVTQRITANLYTAVQRLDLTLKSFNAILADPRNQGNINASIENLRRITDDFRSASADFKVFASDARAFGSEARGSAARFNNTLDTIRTTIDASGRKFTDVADSATRLLRDLDRAAVTMNEGGGSAAMFLNDNRLYESLVLTADRLGKAIDELRDVLKLMKTGNLKYRIF